MRPLDDGRGRTLIVLDDPVVMAYLAVCIDLGEREQRRDGLQLPRAVLRLRDELLELTTPAGEHPSEPLERLEQPAAPACANCGGPPGRRLRSGLCWACYEYQRRTGRPRAAA